MRRPGGGSPGGGRAGKASLDGNTRRAIDLREGERVNAAAFKALLRRAVALNRAGKSKPAKASPRRRG